MKVVDQRFLNFLPSVIYAEVVTHCMSGAYWKDTTGDDVILAEMVGAWQRREVEYLAKHHAQ